MSFILNFLMEAVLGILAIFFNFFIDVTTSTFSLNGKNTLNLFYKTFPGSDTVMQWSQYCGLLIIVAIFFFQLIKIMSGPITKAERPLTLVCRTIIFAAAVGAAKPLCEFIFEVATGPFKAMKSAVGYDIIDNIVDALKSAGNKAGEDIASGSSGVSDFVVGMIAPLITFFLIIALFGAFFKLLLEVVERYLIIGVLTIFSPLAIATGCSSATNNIFGSWLRAMISQCLLMIFSVFFLSVLYNGMIQICVDAVAGLALSGTNLSTTFDVSERITDSSLLCIRVMMLVAWCRLGTTMDRHLQTLGLTTLQAGDGLAMDLRNAGSMAKGVARGGGRVAGAIAAGAGAFAGNKAANGAGGNNNSTINNASGKNSNAVGSGSGATKPGVGSSSMGGSSQGQGISLNSMCGPAGEALKNAADGEITAGNGVEEDGVTKFPLSGPNGEDMGDITLSKDAPEEGRFASITDDDGNTLYAQASNDDVQDLLDNEDAFIAANADDIGGVTNEGVDSSELDDASTIDGTDASMVAGEGAYISDDDNINQEVNIADEGAASFDGDELQEANAALDDVQTFDSAALDENGDIVEGSVPSSISEDQVSFDENGNPYYDADGQKVPLDTNDDGSYGPANCGIVANSNGTGEFVMANDGSMYAATSASAVASSTNIPASQVKTDSNGNPYYSTGGQNIPVKKNSDGSYSLSGAIPASQIKTDSNGNTYCSVGSQNIPVAKNSNGSYSPATSISASQVKNDANGNPYCSVGGQNIPVAKNSDGSYSPTASATSISASQVKADNSGNTYCSVGEQNIPVVKNSDGSYSSSATSIPSASSGLLKNSQGAQPGDSVVTKDSNGNLCSTTLSSSNFSSVSAKGFDGKMHDCKGQLSSNGTVNPSHLVATGFSNVNNMSLNKDGSATLSASDGKKYSVPATNVAVGSNGQVGIRTNGANSFSAKDSSGNSRTFNVSNSAMVSKDRAFCPVNNSSNGSGKTPTNIHYSGLSNKIVADAKNVKVVGSKDSYASKYNLRKDQRVPVSLVGTIKNSGDSNGKRNNMVGTIRGKDVNKLRKNNSKKK